MRFDLVKNSDGTMRMSNPDGDYSTPGGGGSNYTPTHYVSTTGASGGQSVYDAATNSATPCDLTTALLYAVGGNKIQVAPGIYIGVNNNETWPPAWQFANSGSSGNPIIIFTEYPAVHNATNRSELRSGSTTIGAGCPAFGTDGQDYIIWDGFYVNEINSST
ncbi:MAG: hypothetical protein ABW094_09135, partial [Candidatus Thiodiazotropha sp.]